MNETGTRPEGIEVGNAWALRSPELPHTNWFVGSFPSIPESSLRFMRQADAEGNRTGDSAKDIAIKWFVHSPDDPPEWGDNKQTSVGRTLSILAGEGQFELTFSRGGVAYTVMLDTPGDFAIWGPGLEHSWRPIRHSPIMTVRWNPD